ncbi:MAG TPA: class I SAM-dependent methyltransferase [Pirellulales bacterium]|nr:class I SAM-dependent methyltransferase [Pirellulales bacterium]
MPMIVSSQEWTPERVKRFWDWQAAADAPYFSAEVADAVLSFVRFLRLPIEEYLDYGSGPGHLVERFLPFAKGGSGADTSPVTVAQVNARFKGATNWHQCVHISDLPTDLPSDAFDLVTCLEVVEHLDDNTLADTLNELARITRPNGHVLLSTPYAEDLSASMSYCPFCDHAYHRWQHVQSFTPERLQRMLDARGLEVVFCRGVNLLLFSPDKTPLKPWQSPKLWGKLVLARIWDKLLRPTPLRSAAGRQLLGPGPHLIAVARKRSDANPNAVEDTLR